MINRNELIGGTFGSALTYLVTEVFFPQDNLAGHAALLAASLLGGGIGIFLSRQLRSN